MYSSRTAFNDNRFDETGERVRFGESRKMNRARKKGCKTCASRVKGVCMERKWRGKRPFVTRIFGNDPGKVGCTHWTMREKGAFGLPRKRVPIEKDSGYQKGVASHARSTLKPHQRVRIENEQEEQKEETRPKRRR